MAALDSSPPRSGPVSPMSIRRKPIGSPEQGSPQSVRSKQSQPRISMADGSRLGESPKSPVKMNFKPENWAQPSSAMIETRESSGSHSSTTLESEIPTVEAPTRLPPRLPLDFSQPKGTIQLVNATSTERSVSANDFATRPILEDEDNVKSYVVSGSNERKVVDSGDSRHSRETEASLSTPSLSNPQASVETSIATSVSSVSGGINEHENDQHRKSDDVSIESSSEDLANEPQVVAQLQYHHQPFTPQTPTLLNHHDPRVVSSPDLSENGGAVNRHLTPVSNLRRSSMPRPPSAYSTHSDRGRSLGQHGSPSIRAPSAHSNVARRSPNIDNRQSTYAELLNVPYPQPAPAPLTIDNSQLRNTVGSNASLLSSQKTLEMYRQNVKKTTDLSIQYSFAVFLISTAKEQGVDVTEPKKKTTKSGNSPDLSSGGAESDPNDLLKEARAILQKLANAGYPFAQYYLADGYASGLFSKGKEDYNSAFPLFVLAAKHGHAESGYRTGLCYEFGWGCRKDPAKAVQFLRTAASKRHPGAMTRLGKACLSGDLGEKRYREGLKWLKLATESADTMYNAAPYHLGCLYETGYGEDIFKDPSYAAELFTQAADLGHPEASFRMGDAYEHGKLNCPRDPALSVHFYTGAAERGHAAAMMGLCAWYMVGAEPILEKDEEEAYEWARRSAEQGSLSYLMTLWLQVD